jgi:hypothetical protein
MIIKEVFVLRIQTASVRILFCHLLQINLINSTVIPGFDFCLEGGISLGIDRLQHAYAK